jgi:hypothetical protein
VIKEILMINGSVVAIIIGLFLILLILEVAVSSFMGIFGTIFLRSEMLLS